MMGSPEGVTDSLSIAELPIGVLLLDRSGVIRAANAQARAMFSGGELEGRLAASLLPTAGDLPENPALLGPGLEVSALRPDGSRFTAIARVRVLDRPLGGLFALFVDEAPISRQTFRCKEHHVARLFERARVIAWEASVETFQFTYVGPQAEAILGYPISAWYEQDFWPKHVHPADRERAVETCLSRTSDHDDFEFEYRMLSADGRVVWILDVVTVVRGPGGAPRIIAGYMLDVTERKRAQEEQQRLVSELGKAVRARDDFISVASHELRGPLTPIKLQLQKLQRRLSDAGAAPMPELDKALNQVNRLGQLIGLLLDATRAAAGRLVVSREPLDLADAARAVVGGFAEEALEAGSRVTLQVPRQLLGEWDRLRIEQVLTNLLSNALKFGAGRPIEVRLSERGSWVELSVRDHGQGIAPEDLERIFERFTRLGTSRPTRGLGLGLYLTREIVRAHRGRIWVESAPLEGSTLHVELPVREEVTAPPPEPSSPAPPG